MEWRELGQAVAKGAPLLGALLSATPAGAVISAAGALIGSALGVDATPEAIVAQIAANPEAFVRLREIESANAIELQRLLVQLEAQRTAAATAELQTAAADRADARALQTQTNSRMPAVLSVSVTLGYFSVLGYMLTSTTWKASDNPTLLLLLGSLATAWGAVMNFHFGTSAGSARKDALIAGDRRRA